MSNPHTSPGSRPLEQLKVAELREELKKRGLSLKGVKKDLIERLDEAVQIEQAGLLESASEGVEEEHRDAHGVHEPEGEHGITHSAGHPQHHGTSESVQVADGLLYLNDSENPLQGSGLIVNNASPYVGASDAIPVSMEPLKDAEKPSTEFAEGKDDVLLENNLNSASSGGLPESSNTGAVEVTSLDNRVQESNAGFTGDDKHSVEGVFSPSEPDGQAGGNQVNLPEEEVGDAELSEEILQASGNVVAMPEAISHGSLAAPKIFKDINSTVSMEGTLSIHKGSPSRYDATIGETLNLSKELEAVEATCQGEVAILSEPVKDVAFVSVSCDLSATADTSMPASSGPVIANDNSVPDTEVLESTPSFSIGVVSTVFEPVSNSGGKVETVEDTIAKVENIEDNVQVDSLDSGQPSILPLADAEAPVMPPDLATVEVMQDPILPEAQQNLVVPESLQDSVMQEVVQDVVVQEVAQDVEMVEGLENPSMNMEVSEVVLETKLPAVSTDILDHPMGLKSENIGSLHAVNSNKEWNEAARAMVDEEKPNIKPEPVESEPRAPGRVVPVENVKVEPRDVKDDLHKSTRTYDRSRPRENDYERSRHEVGRTSVYANDRNRGEGRSSRVFREERRKDPRERDLKPSEEVFSDRSSQKRRHDERDAKQQEPAKRVRRWNSGNDLVVEPAKPLTTGSVKEIMSPELKEGFAAASPLLTPKLSGPSMPSPAAVKTSSEANGDQRAVPPPARAPTSSLRVDRFVRPFTLKAVKDLLSKYGQCVDFWMDQIKTHCYVMYSKVDEAVAARNDLYNMQWPASFGNLLVAEFVEPSEVKIRSDGTFEKMHAPAMTPRGVPNQPPQGASLPGSYHSHSNALAFAPPLRDRQGMQVVPMKEPEPPVPTLDDLFRKTKAKPHLYYLPLTDEQVMEKLASARNKEQQQQGRSSLPGRA